MTEHSICHPGRPAPQGDGHEGSPGFDAFQSAKSAADRRPVLLVNEPTEPISISTDNKVHGHLLLPPRARDYFCSMVQVSRNHGHPIYQRPKC